MIVAIILQYHQQSFECFQEKMATIDQEILDFDWENCIEIIKSHGKGKFCTIMLIFQYFFFLIRRKKFCRNVIESLF